MWIAYACNYIRNQYQYSGNSGHFCFSGTKEVKDELEKSSENSRYGRYALIAVDSSINKH